MTHTPLDPPFGSAPATPVGTHITGHGHPPHSLVSWSAVIAGALVAIAVGAMLNLLGAALGAAAFNPYEFDGSDMEGFTAAAGFWMLIANALALFVGGAVASRAAKYSDHHKGALHGLGVWALAFVIAILIASAGAAGGVSAVMGGEASREPAREVTAADMLAPDRALPEGVPVTPPQEQRSAERASDSASTLALWGFLTMLAGAVAAVLGGAYGTRGHRWMTKAGLAGETLPPKA